MVAYLNTQTIAEAQPTLDANEVGILLNNLAYMVKAITGKDDWKTAPTTTLEAINSAISTLQAHATSMSNPHSVTASQTGSLVDINNVSNPGGGVDLIGGTGITIAPDNVNKRVVITATGTAAPGPHMHTDSEINVLDANQHFTAGTLDGVLDELFTSVSNGKTLVAAAITDKGVTASGSDTFTVLADKIDNIVLVGDAVESDVVAGKTFSNDFGTGKVGTMINRGAYNITPGTNNVTIPQGYHSGAGVVYGDADLVAENIVNTKNIFGVTGVFKGSTIKSRQHGTVSLTTNTETSVTIASVDTSKAIVRVWSFDSDHRAYWLF